MYDMQDPLEVNTRLEEKDSVDMDRANLIAAGLVSTIHVHQPMLVQAHQALLDKPYISSNNEEYFLIKKHYEALKEWHRLHTGWRIERRNDLFRLLRQSSLLPVVYRESKQLLQPNDFVYVFWILWYAANDQIAKRGNGQLFLIGQMLERLREEWHIAGCHDHLMLERQTTLSNESAITSNRKSMANALKYLQDLQYLKELDGRIDDWVTQDEPVLYQFTRAIHLLILSLDTTTLEEMTQQQKTYTVSSTQTVLNPQKKQTSALTRAWRALLLGPFLLKYDDREAFAALIHQQSVVREMVDASFGWSLEVNHDYACIVRDASSSSIGFLNPRNTYDQIILLICDELRREVTAGRLQPDYYGCILMNTVFLLDLLTSVRSRFEAFWGKGVRNKENSVLLEDILMKMRRIGFLRGPENKQILILPTAARYRVQYREQTEDMLSHDSTEEEQNIAQYTTLWSDEPKTFDQ